MLNLYQQYPQAPQAKQTLKFRLQAWMVNDGQKVVFVGLWSIAMAMVFGTAYINYAVSDNFKTMRGLFGTVPLSIARASALCLHACASIILFPVCRNVISLLRTTPLNSVIPFDDAIPFHKVIAWTILFFSLIHTGAHVVNYATLAQKMPENGNWAVQWFTNGPGYTGNIMLISLIAIVTTAIKKVRRRNFEVFWYTHHLFIVFFGFWAFHGAFCVVQPDREPKCANAAAFWKYWLANGLMYLAERVLREWRGRESTIITKVVMHPSNVVEVQIKKPTCRTKAGQYIFLCCPEVSLWQWHPFTLTSAPEEDFISVHIRVVGDFTREFASKLGCDVNSKNPKSSNQDGDINRLLPRLMIDGPFGSASEDVFKFEVAMLFGAGIGVTPFASILKSIWYRMNYPTQSTKLTKVYFFWVCRDYQAFEWFQDLLKAIEDEDVEQYIEIHTYLTGRLKEDQIHNVIQNDEEGFEDAVTGLRAPTHYGRPNLDQIFSGVAHHHPETDVGVFFCGPKPLGRQLHLASNKYTQPTKEGTRFFYNKENF
ncbi:ferric reductase NAD binding domain-containing protein [Syncephalis fuscata]|nr:ferric reductase NAD binding domain-containing protein [Syncephalis fuscata]